MSLSVIVLGATGLVGKTMLRILEQRDFPVGTLRLLASDRAGDRTLDFRDHAHPVNPVSAEAFAGVDLALFASANAVSQQWAPVARAAGVTVVDLSSAFRYDDPVPLVVPEVNGALLAGHPTLVANPNCSTIGLVVALAPLARAVGLERVVVSTYQSVSGAGSEALDELERGVRGGLDGPPPARRDGGAPFAFNVVPHIDRFEENGYSREEMKVVWETRKILGLPDLPVTATAVRVPVRVGHAASVNVTLARPLDPEEARALWRAAPGLVVVDAPGEGRYPTPLAAEGRDEVFVGRARRDLSHPRGLEFFVTSDNLRKGAATNAVQIAEGLTPAPSGAPGGARRDAAPGPKRERAAGPR
ncbi:MAG: aspartate-semialdehyde dehydrogenase [Candidatus Eisenbacteria bacterium]|uniref:Aspartate-semialdehyde dehydrogenase n=1 Tax=Eiseniibacteriota bacterium TaxID=2212470 RepID=A0A538UD56_UNCEI|nr:MAG: aspartate-semialdehyde dehydrogenase [Candidatus Eisenbacteria bacterium]